MEDRYLFKAKFDDSYRWVKGQLVEVNDTYLIIPNHASKILAGWFSASNVVEVKKDTICQCTGLKDKNGKLIWENDILNSGNLVVTWRKELASYCLSKKGWMYQHFFGEAVDACDCEVIGNIFDNSELIHE